VQRRPDGRPYGPQDYAQAQQQQEQLIPQKQKKQKPPKQPKPSREGGGAWKVVLQFVVGLLVIAGVAAAIVALYIKYYQ
jgi:cytoskeletal protein RodZ